jgi:lysylphosphatidylglycerol synthetase-like protein (DUF2156 family)
MNKPSAFFVLMVGLLVTIMGVGGIEASMDDAGLLSGVAVATIGVLSMFSGWLGLLQHRY